MKNHEPARTSGRPFAPALTGREVRRLTDIVLAAEAAGAPIPAIAAITPGLTFEDAFLIRQQAFARRLSSASAIAAVVALPDSPVRFYTDTMTRHASEYAETRHLQLTAQPVVLFRKDHPSPPRPVVGIEVRRVPSPHPAREDWQSGHDDVCTNGGAHLLILPEPDNCTGKDPVIGNISWSVDDTEIACGSPNAPESNGVVAAMSRAIDELSAELPEKNSAIHIGVEPLAPVTPLAAGTVATLRFTTATEGGAHQPDAERIHRVAFTVQPQTSQNESEYDVHLEQ